MEASFADAGIVRNGILTLYAQSLGHAEANAFLIAFEASDQAWQVLLQLITESMQPQDDQQIAMQQEQVAFFASNLMHSKVCKHWKSLGNTLLGILTAVAEQRLPMLGKAVLTRLCLTLAAVSLRTLGGATTFIQLALSFGSQGFEAFAAAAASGNGGLGLGVGSGSSGGAAVRVCLELLRQLPAELEAADLPRQRKEEISHGEVQPQLEGVFALCNACLDAEAANSAVPGNGSLSAAGGGAEGAGGAAQQEAFFASEALKCCSEWVGVKPGGVGLSALASGAGGAGRGLFERLLQRMSGGGGGGGGSLVGVADAAKVLTAVVAVVDQERCSEEHHAAARALRDAVLATRPLLQQTAMTILAGDDDDDSGGGGGGGSGFAAATGGGGAGGGVEAAEEVTHSLALLCCEFCCGAQLERMCSQLSATSEDLAFVGLVLSMLTAHPLRRVALLTQDLWLEVADLGLGERAEPLKASLNAQLLEVLVTQCTYPLDFTGDWDDLSSSGGVDQDVFSELRGESSGGGSGVGDVLSTCFYVLKAQFFVALAPRLELNLDLHLQQQQQPAGSALACWQPAEAALFAMCAVGKDALRFVGQDLMMVPGVEDRIAVQQGLVSLLLLVLKHVVEGSGGSLPLVQQHPLLLRAGASLVGCYHPLLFLDQRPAHTIGFERSKPQMKEASLQVAQAHAAQQQLAEVAQAPGLLTSALGVACAALAHGPSTASGASALRSLCVGAAAPQMRLLVARGGGEALWSCLGASSVAGGSKEDRTRIVEGMARVLVGMVTDPVIQALVGQAGTAAGSGSAEEAAARAAAGAGGASAAAAAASAGGVDVARQQRHAATQAAHAAASVLAGSAVLRFASPMLRTLTEAVEARQQQRGASLNLDSDENVETETVVEALDLLGTVVQFLDLPLEIIAQPTLGRGGAAAGVGQQQQQQQQQQEQQGQEQHVAMPLLSSLVPLLGAVATWADSSVASAAFRCFAKVFLNLRHLVSGQLPALVGALVSAFDAHHWPAALDCVGSTVEAFGDQPATVGSFHDLLSHLSQSTCARLTTHGHSPFEEPALVKAFFSACKAFVVFCPAALLAPSSDSSPAQQGALPPLLATLFDLAVACLECCTERDSNRSVLGFVAALFSLAHDRQSRPVSLLVSSNVAAEGGAGSTQAMLLSDAFAMSVLPVASEKGQRLVSRLFAALGGGGSVAGVAGVGGEVRAACPSALRDPLSECLATVLMALGMDELTPLGPSNRAWVVAALSGGGGGQGNSNTTGGAPALGGQAVAQTGEASNGLELLDGPFRERCLHAMVAYTSTANSNGAAAAAAEGVGGGGGGRPQNRRPLLKRKLKVVLSDLARVCAGEHNAEDCIYDLANL